MSPFEVKERLEKQRKSRRNPHDTFATQVAMAELMLLYKDVLKEIAKGSIDPKSLARAALGQEW